MAPALTPAQAKRFYDRLGRGQDSQAFYEDRATDRLFAPLRLGEARAVFEFGCGTGRFAAKLLARHLPADARYLGVDLSETMTALATARLRPWAGRAAVVRVGGAMPLPGADGAFDRFVTTFVLDLLSEETIAAVVGEAHRLLAPGGLMGLVSLTEGEGGAAAAVSRALLGVHRLVPSLFGGCRPVRLAPFVDPARWDLVRREVVQPFALAAEILVARRR